MKYSDIYRLYSTSQPKDAIHQALREVPVDDSDEQYEDRSPLHLACQYGDTEGVKILLERDAEPNTKDANGSTPIHILGRTSAGCADEDKLKEIAVMLIEQGANIPRSAKNTTALIECIRNRHFKMAEAIINSGTRVNSTDLNGENVLFGFCAASGDIRRDIRFAKKELDESVQYRYPENKIEEIRSRIARLEDDGETAYRLARRLVEEDKVDPEDKSNSGKTAVWCGIWSLRTIRMRLERTRYLAHWIRRVMIWIWADLYGWMLRCVILNARQKPDLPKIVLWKKFRLII